MGHYNSLAGSYGYQAGLQTYGYALFLMNDQALQYLDQSDGWEIGVGPSIVVLDKGKGKSVTSTTLTKDVYAFIFNQKGLMAGVGIQGSKITKVRHPPLSTIYRRNDDDSFFLLFGPWRRACDRAQRTKPGHRPLPRRG